MTTTSEWSELIALAQQNAAQIADAAPARGPHHEARQWLRDCDFLPKYHERYDPAVRLDDAPSEAALAAWVEDLPRMLTDGGWLFLGGHVGTRKSYALCRIAHKAMGLQVSRGEGWQPRQLVPGAEVVWYFAPSIQSSLLTWDGDCDDAPGSMYRLLHARLLLLDDVDRFLELRDNDFALGKILSKLDTLMEYRDQPRLVTVVTANRWAQDMREVPEFCRWIDRAGERGALIDIHGGSVRRIAGRGTQRGAELAEQRSA